MGLTTIGKIVAPAPYGNNVTPGNNRTANSDTSNNPPAATQPDNPIPADRTGKIQESVDIASAENPEHKGVVTITYDEQSGVTVFKSFDSKGNVVSQAPPSQVLKTLALEGQPAEADKGLIINKKV